MSIQPCVFVMSFWLQLHPECSQRAVMRDALAWGTQEWVEKLVLN